MKSTPLGPSGLKVSRLSYGCMRIAGTWDPKAVDDAVVEKGVRVIEAAWDAGYTFYDHADIYCQGQCERIFGEALRRHPKWRKKMVIATKCGIRFAGDPSPDSPHRYDFSATHIHNSVKGSLERLGVETIDVLQLHRPDYLADPEEVFKAFTKLAEKGMVRAFGVSNFRPRLVAAFRSNFDFPLVCHQIEASLTHLEPFENGVLDQCLKQEMTPMAWGPLGAGKLGDDATAEGDSNLAELHRTLDSIAPKYELTRSETALAWLLRHPSNIIPVIGTTREERIRSIARTAAVELDREDWYRLLVAARGERLP